MLRLRTSSQVASPSMNLWKYKFKTKQSRTTKHNTLDEVKPFTSINIMKGVRKTSESSFKNYFAWSTNRNQIAKLNTRSKRICS